jgi:hypothetical protein
MNPVLFWMIGGAIIFALIIIVAYSDHAKVDRYEYLEVLSFTEWKSGRDIKLELEKRNNGWLGYGEVYINLSHLQEEGLVERQTVTEILECDGRMKTIRVAEFRRKSGGRRKPETEEKTPGGLVLEPA